MSSLLTPDAFQGSHAKAPYFEGWYFRLQKGDHSISLIPGICLEPQPHAYLQILNAENKSSIYREYPLRAFQFREDQFRITVGTNRFSAHQIVLKDPQLHGTITFTDRVPFSCHRLSTGMMGPFAFLPAMQCKHGVVTIRSTLSGSLADETGEMDFSGGVGYVEKDWGSAFPSPYLWTQAHFDTGTFMLCLARVPIPGGTLTGILSFLYTGQTRYAFSTYTGAQLAYICRTEDQTLHLALHTPLHRLYLQLRTQDGIPLRAPGTHGMNRVIYEDPHAALSVRLTTRAGATLFQGQSTDAGSEIVGNILSLSKHRASA